MVEVDFEKRSLGNRKFRVKLFGDDVELNLHKSEHFNPEQLMAHFLDVDEDGNRVIEDYTHRVRSQAKNYSPSSVCNVYSFFYNAGTCTTQCYVHS